MNIYQFEYLVFGKCYRKMILEDVHKVLEPACWEEIIGFSCIMFIYVTKELFKDSFSHKKMIIFHRVLEAACWVAVVVH